MKRVAMFAATVLTTVAVLLLVWEFHEAIILFVMSLIVAAAIRKPATLLAERGLPRGAAVALTYLAAIGLIGGLLVLAVFPLLVELQQASDAFAMAYEAFQENPPAGAAYAAVAERLPDLDMFYESISSGAGADLLGRVFGTTLSVAGTASELLLVLALSVYWGLDQVRFERLWLSLLPAEQRAQARVIGRRVEAGLGAYVRSEVAQMILAGIGLAIGFAALGVPYPVLLALLGALAWLIPLVGGMLALVPVILSGLTVSPWLALAGAGLALTLFIVLETVVEQRLFDRRRYSSILIVVIMVAMADALGLVGLLIAPPLAAALQIFFGEVFGQPGQVQPAVPETRPDMGAIRNRLGGAQALARETESASPVLISLLGRLTTLVEETEAVLGPGKSEGTAGGMPRIWPGEPISRGS